MGADQSGIKKGKNAALKNQDLNSLSNFSPNYILKLKERFERGSEDYCLDADSLKTFFKCSTREVEVLMKMFDMDQNGSIDSYEFVCALSLMSHANLDEKAELIFNLYDFDRSQSISKDELTVLMANVMASLRSMEGKPAPTINEIEEKTDELFEKADENKDNEISLKEFKNYIKSDKQILSVLMSYGVAKSEDLGTDFGAAGADAPTLDEDLDEEINPKGLQVTEKKQRMKEGIDFAAPKADDEFGSGEVEAGDQFMAIKPWMGVIANSVPDGYKPNKRDGDAPDATLDLEYVHGFRCHDMRNNLRYTKGGKLAYCCAGVGVIMDTASNTQKHFMDHTDDIHSLALHPNGNICATGQIGPKPRLCIWDNTTMECTTLITQPLTKGIKHLAFSPDGKYLAATAMDDDQMMAIYDWQTPPKKGKALAPIAHGKSTRAKILSLGFNTAGDTVIATCVKEVSFFTFAGGKIKGQKGIGWKPSAESVLTQACVGNTLFTGGYGGDVIAWNGRNIGKKIKAHEGRVNCMFADKNRLVTGGHDGKVNIFSVSGASLTLTDTLDLAAPGISSAQPKATSVCFGPGNKVLVGTRGGEIIEFNGEKKPNVYMRSHFESELWGLAMHPTRPEMVTYGRDSMLAIWDMPTRRQKIHTKLEGPGDAVAISNSGDIIAVGMINGTFQAFDIKMKNDGRVSFKSIKARKDRNPKGKAIQIIKFSPDDKICAVGAHDSQIILYNAENNFTPTKRIKSHHSTITHIDFSLDSAAIMSNCTSYEILFHDTSNGKQITGGASQFKNEPWATWTCTLGWPVQGIWPPCADGSDINCIERSPDGTVVATGDDFRTVKLFRYPCPVDEAAGQKYSGHSEHVTNIGFSKNKKGDSYLISTGGEDKTIFQWRYLKDKAAAEESQNIADAEEEGDTFNENGDAEDDGGFGDDDDGDEFGEVALEEGDQRGCVDVWRGQVDASVPDGFQLTRAMGKAPENNLTLKWAHGFRSFDTRGNLRYNSDGNVVFTTAGVGVVYDKDAHTQEFFNMHHEDIVAMAMHPDGDHVATGQMAGKALTDKTAKGKGRQELKQGKLVDVFVWKSSTREVVAKISGFQRRAISQLAFSPNGEKLLTIGKDDHNSAAVYNWANQAILGSTKVDPGQVFAAAWKDETTFSTCGMKHCKTFTLSGSNLNGKKNSYSGTAGMIAMTSLNYVLNGVLVTGAQDGGLIKWNGSSAGKPIKKHTDAIWSIEKGSQPNTFITGGNDGQIIIWNAQFAPTKTIDLNKVVKLSAGLRTIDVASDGTLLCGTRGSDVVEVTPAGQLKKTIVQGHFQGVTKNPEVWGACAHPTEQRFASCGSDKTVRVWDPTRMVAVSEQFTHDPTAIDWSRDGTFLAFGDRNGEVKVLDAETLKVLGSAKSALAGKKDAWIEDIKISPCSKFVAFGTHGGLSKVDIQKVGAGKKLTKYCSTNIGISSALSHLDWSQDSSQIVLNSQANELMFFDINSKKCFSASSAKSIDWQTWTCIFGFPVQGIWPGLDYTDVNTVDRSRNGTLLATGDDFGQVKLFKYPCVKEKADFNDYFGHSSHVTKVKFSANDALVFSTGGGDKTCLVWTTDIGDGGDLFGQGQAEEEDDESDGEDIEDENRLENAKDQRKQTKSKRQVEEKAEIKAQIKQLKQEEDNGGDFDDDEFGEEELAEGDEFMSVKPWIGQMREPTGYNKPPVNQEKAPTTKFELEWIHGFRGSNAKNNIAYLSDDSVAYFAAAVGVVYDSATHTQRHFLGHTDDILAIAYHKDKNTIATGENGPKPKVFIWDGLSMQVKHELKGNGIVKSVRNVSFSPSGDLLAVVDNSDDHNLAVYDTSSGTCVAKSKGDRSAIVELAFKSETQFATVGAKHFKEWTIGSGNIKGKMGNFNKKDNRHGSIAVNKQTYLTGCFTGELYAWNGTTLGKVASKNHTKLIDAITVQDGLVFTGGRDKLIFAMDANDYKVKFKIDCATFTGSSSACIRGITMNTAKTKLMVGTFGHEVWEVPVQVASGKVGKPIVHVHGHYAPLVKWNNECWGLSVFPNKEQYATCSWDQTLRIWCTTNRKMLKSIDLNINAKGEKIPVDPTTKEPGKNVWAASIDVSPNSAHMAVGTFGGTLKIFKCSDWKLIYEKQISKKHIEDLKFSPDGNYLVVGSHDQKLYLYNVPDFKMVKKFGRSSASVIHIDWSLDSQSIRTNDASYEILYYSMPDGQQDTGGATNHRDEKWETQSCILGWATQGIWQPGQDGTDINHCDRTHGPLEDGMELIASGNDDGEIKVFRYPAMVENADCQHLLGHSSHVTKVRFNYKNTYLFSTGGNDTTVMQWKINPE